MQPALRRIDASDARVTMAIHARETRLNAILAQRIDVHAGLAILRIVPDGWVLPEFRAGQFAVVGLPGSAPRCAAAHAEPVAADPDNLIRRAYSIASSSWDRTYIELYVSLVPTGALAPRLFALRPGDRLWLSPKFSGTFTLDRVPNDEHVVFVATGTGLAPYMSMLRSHLTCGRARRFVVLHGARHSRDLGYRTELTSMRGICSNFGYLPALTRPQEETEAWDGEVGRLQELWTDGVVERVFGFRPTPFDTHVFLCGNPSMIDAMAAVLGADGFAEHSARRPGSLHVERYW